METKELKILKEVTPQGHLTKEFMRNGNEAREFLAEEGKWIKGTTNYAIYLYNGRYYACGWDSKLNKVTGQIYGWIVFRIAKDEI